MTLPNVIETKRREHSRQCFRFRKHPIRLLPGTKLVNGARVDMSGTVEIGRSIAFFG